MQGYLINGILSKSFYKYFSTILVCIANGREKLKEKGRKKKSGPAALLKRDFQTGALL